MLVPPGTAQAEALAELGPTVHFTPWSIGSLILLKQLCRLQTLKSIFGAILHEASRPREESPDPAAAVPASEPTNQVPAKVSLSGLITLARNQRETLGESLELLHTEPLVLAYYVDSLICCQPNAVPDEQGHRESAETDRDVCAAFYQAVHVANQGPAVWKYITHLLELLEKCTLEGAYRTTLLQEISNACHVEYGRVQALFRQLVQTTVGADCFERVANVYDEAGNPRVIMKGKPEELAQDDAQLYCILRLCQPETNASKAVYWKDKLIALHKAHHSERRKLGVRQSETLWDLFAIVQLVQDLPSVVSIPLFSRKKRRAFVSKSRKLGAELGQIGRHLSSQESSILLSRLSEPKTAKEALNKLDEMVAEKAGTKMSILYQNLVQECISNIRKQHPEAEPEYVQENAAKWVPLPASSQQSPRRQIEPQRRRQKTKTRPAHSSALETAPPEELPAPQQVAATPQILTVSSSTAAVFSTLFRKSQARGSVSWVAFEAAMADVGFAITPNCGSIYNFLPPDNLAVQRPFTFHRPHDSHIEGHLLHVLARRLKRVYDWDEDTFRTA